MLEYSKNDFQGININASATEIARQFIQIVEDYWCTHVPKHPLYLDRIPVDGGYIDLSIAILNYFLQIEKIKKSKECRFYIERILCYLEVDPPSELKDRSVLNHLTKDKKHLNDGILWKSTLATVLDEAVQILNNKNKIFNIKLNALDPEIKNERREQYNREIFICFPEDREKVINKKREKIYKIEDKHQNYLKTIFESIADDDIDKFRDNLNIRRINENNPLLRQTPLCFAIQCRAKEIIRILIQKGANVNLKDETGRYPIHYAVKSGVLEIFDNLLENNTDPFQSDLDGWTSLHYAVRYLSSPKNDSEREAIFDRLTGPQLTRKIGEHRFRDFIRYCDRKNRMPLHYALGLKLTRASKILKEKLGNSIVVPFLEDIENCDLYLAYNFNGNIFLLKNRTKRISEAIVLSKNDNNEKLAFFIKNDLCIRREYQGRNYIAVKVQLKKEYEQLLNSEGRIIRMDNHKIVNDLIHETASKAGLIFKIQEYRYAPRTEEEDQEAYKKIKIENVRLKNRCGNLSRENESLQEKNDQLCQEKDNVEAEIHRVKESENCFKRKYQNIEEELRDVKEELQETKESLRNGEELNKELKRKLQEVHNTQHTSNTTPLPSNTEILSALTNNYYVSNRKR